MDSHKRAARLFSKAKNQGLIGLNGDGAPTIEMVAEAIDDGDYSAEASELAAYCRRLVRIVRMTDPENSVARSCVEFLRCIGETSPMR
jgi:Asp-tRNA(Asn)/Glu-tRNA(Gln) amidotransferase B subunit